ncbi:trk system potassium uptake protein TrkA [Propioniferax innocua]|uniref:Trk system potassium uptake protein TrkA n=1 Tax=Propioniferax innocua TaxID=1753 RepID=A0A542ZQB7_9ACTN|nr:trk system potassium uptake protein TrkA [Propioniferax innocua]
MAVLGLGRFGAALALELMEVGVEVLGVDKDPAVIDELSGQLTHTVTADTTDERVLQQLGIDESEWVVVGIGSDIEASILTASRLLKFGVHSIWAKAISEPHAEILSQMGVRHVISPESDMGRRVAHLIRGRVNDYMRIDEDLTIVRMRPTSGIVGRPLKDLDLRARFGVTVIALKCPGETWAMTHGESIVAKTDEILVAGTPGALEALGVDG